MIYNNNNIYLHGNILTSDPMILITAAGMMICQGGEQVFITCGMFTYLFIHLSTCLCLHFMHIDSLIQYELYTSCKGG